MTRALIIGRSDEEPLQSASLGLQRLGVSTRAVTHGEWRASDEADLVVIYGLRAWGRDILDHYDSQGVPVVVVDLGYIDRAHTAADLADGYLYVGVGGLGSIADPGHDGIRAARLSARPAEPKTGPIRRALICGQVAYDASHRMSPADLMAAYHGMEKALRFCGIPEIHFRSHPLGKDYRPNIPEAPGGYIGDVLPWYDLVVSINSNAGLDALLSGLPVAIAKPCHYQSLAYPMACDLSKVRAPDAEQVAALIRRLSYSQWLLSEITDGLPFDFLMKQGKI